MLKNIILTLLLLSMLVAGSLGAAPSFQTDKYATILWVDGSANLDRTNSREDIIKLLDKCRNAGIKTIMVDAKAGSGFVSYNSKIAPRYIDWKGKKYNPEFDRLQVFVEEGHKRGLTIIAAFFVFGEGHHVFKKGPVYDSHPEWATQILTEKGVMPIIHVPNKTAKVNPLNPEVQRYELSLLEEVVKNYKVDGVLLDGCRFDSFYTDFSDISRRKFEGYLKQKYGRNIRFREWPVGFMDYVPEPEKVKQTEYYNDWLLFRTKTIYDFISTARYLVKSQNPDLLFTAYAGSWYPTYYQVGVNWASKKYFPPLDWTPKGFEQYGYADMLDFFCSGCYYFDVSIAEMKAKNPQKEDYYSVEGAAELTKKVIMGDTPAYGTLYVQDYKGHPRQFVRAMEMLKQKSDGIALFDLSQLDGFDYWKYVKLVNSKAALNVSDLLAVPENDEEKRLLMPPNTIDDFAIDNTDPQCLVSGNWQTAKDIPGFLGSNYLVINTPKSTPNDTPSNDFVRWTSPYPLEGKYRIYVSYTSSTNNSSHVTYSVISPPHDIEKVINQKENGGQWNELGIFDFQKDTQPIIQLNLKSGEGTVIADAVRIVKLHEN